MENDDKNVDEQVSWIVHSPVLRQNLELALRTTPNQKTLVIPPSTPSTSTESTSSAVNANSTIFSRGTRGRRGRRSKSTTPVRPSTSSPLRKTFYKDVFVVQSNSTLTTYKHKSRYSAFESGHAVSNASFDTSWSHLEIKTHIKYLFPFLSDIDFEIVLPIRGRLTKITADLNGALLKSIFHQKAIYIRPLSDPDVSDSPEIPLINVSNDLNGTMGSIENAGDETISLGDILQNIRINLIEEQVTEFNVYRADIFGCCLRGLKRKSFNPFNKINVNFTDSEGTMEGAVDVGGPTREFFRLLLQTIRDSRLFIGKKNKFITLDYDAMKKNEYYYAGVIMSLSLVHGGPGPHFISENLHEAICKDNLEGCEPSLDFIDYDIAMKIKEFKNIEKLEDLREYIFKEVIFTIAGVYNIKCIEEKDCIIRETTKFYNCFRVKPAFDQFRHGLRTCNILDAMTAYPKLFKSLMCFEKQKITSALFMNIFEISFSEDGSNKRNAEIRTVTFFRDVLKHLEDDENEISLENFLIFVTGADCVPPLGFPLKPKLKFLHNEDVFPTAHTCNLELYLPCYHKDYEQFEKHIVFAVANCKDFAFV